ncbi:MAG: glycerol kinase GlpK [Simkaniaceae bacterium]|nr:glycerol kinase GlpK [Simkaniaceae bacterium]
MGYILALDQGTTSSRALIVDEKAHVKGLSQREFEQIFPESGWVEHDATEIWSSQAAVIAEVFAKTKIPMKEIRAIGITNQRETTVIWDRASGRPIYNAIVWQDRRTFEFCKELKHRGFEDLVNRKTGLTLDPYFSATKIRWILNHIEGAKEKAARGELAFGTIDTWLIWNLTCGRHHITDVTNASRTMLFNINTLEWDQDLLDLFEIPRSLLPEVHSSSEVYGQAQSELFSTPIPIAGIAGDQQSSLFGHACTEKGMIKTTYGTGAFSLLNIGPEPTLSKHRLLTTIAWQMNGQTTYALEGSVFMAGASIQWLRDGLKMIENFSDVDRLADTVQNTNGVYIVPSFTGLGAPHWDPKARGTILGLSRGTTRAHLCLAMLEGIAFQVSDVIQSMMLDAKLENAVMRVDGGVTVSKRLMQFQSDLLQMKIEKPTSKEMTALGASFLAGLAVGYWKNIEEIAALWLPQDAYAPHSSSQEIQLPKKNWMRAIACAKLWENEPDATS